MAVESKPLFHPEVLRQQVRSFNLPDQTAVWQPKLQHWAGLITSGQPDQFKESELLPDFLTDFFYGLLGYSGPAEAPGSYTLSRERHVEVDGEFADAVLGRFQKDKAQFVAVLEGKGILGHIAHGAVEGQARRRKQGKTEPINPFPLPLTLNTGGPQ